MRKLFTILMLVVTTSGILAQNDNQKIVIDVASTDFKVYKSVMLTINIMTQSHPNTQFEVMAYGEAVPMFMKEQSAISKEISKHIRNKNVKFTACEVSMSLFNIKREQLLDGIDTVENAVAAISKKQGEGWNYIKAGN